MMKTFLNLNRMEISVWLIHFTDTQLLEQLVDLSFQAEFPGFV